MPYKIEITGDTIQAVFQDVMNMAIVMGQGGNNAFKAVPAAPPAEPIEPPASSTEQTAGVVAEENPKIAPLPAEKRKPGRPPKAQVIDADPLDITVADAPAAKTYTLKDDIQPRVRAIGEAFKGRADVGKDEKVVQKEAVDYILKLFGKYGMKTSNDLKPEQFADFMRDSEPYLAGTA